MTKYERRVTIVALVARFGVCDMSALSNAVPLSRDRRSPRVNQLVFIRGALSNESFT